MALSPEQQYSLAKTLPIPELAKVLQGQSDVVDMWVAESMLRQKTQAQKAQQGMAAQQMANAPKVVQRDLAAAQQLMQPAQQLAMQQVPQPRMEQGVAGLPVGSIGEIGNTTGAGGGIVAFDDGGEVPGFAGPTGSLVGAPLQSTIKPGAGPTFASAFPDIAAAEKAAAEASALSGGKVSFTAALRRILGPAYAAYEAQSLYRTGMDYDTGMGYGDAGEQMTIGTPMQAPRERAVDKVMAVKQAAADQAKAAAQAQAAAPTSGIAETQPAPEAKPERSGIAALDTRLVDTLLPIPKERTRSDFTKERLEAYKEMGVDPELYQKQIEKLAEEKTKSAGDRTEAGWMRALEAGLGIMGGESPYAFTNIGKGAQSAAKGAMEDIKEFNKLDRDRRKAEQDLLIAQNAFNKSGADADLARVEKASDHRDNIMAKRADLTEKIYVANQTLAAHNLTRLDTRDATLKATALKQAEAEMAKRLALNPNLASDPTAYARELDSIYYEHLRRLMGEKAPAQPSRGSLQNVNGRMQYVPAN